MIFSKKKSPQRWVIILIMVLILFLPIALMIGSFLGRGVIESIKKNKVTVTLNNPINDASGNPTPELRDLELYQTTDTDYRFKNDTTKREYIIPKEQVQIIISQ